MIKTPIDMRLFTQDLTASVWTLGAIGALLESGLVVLLHEPRSLEELATRCPTLSKGLIERCLAVAAAAGIVTVNDGRYLIVEGAAPFSQQPFRSALQGDIRSTLIQSMLLLDAAAGKGSDAGWRYTDPVLLQAQGDSSALFPPMFKMNIVPALGNLAARLDAPGSRFLDIGVGVAAFTIAMCRIWPNLQVVGIDPFDAPLAIARENIKQADLVHRIELRKIAAQDLRDEGVFDLAWLPSFFIPAPVLSAVLDRVLISLNPGGWLLFPIGGFVGDDRQRTGFALANEFWGGPVLYISEAEALLKQVGFKAIRALPGPPVWPQLLVAQRGTSPAI
jgi:2-polyprenyl-3-methyl-5-hydroxy-6-metoxy-1,4-benzoquinol methylase